MFNRLLDLDFIGKFAFVIGLIFIILIIGIICYLIIGKISKNSEDIHTKINKILQKYEFTEKEKIDYYIEYLKTNTDIRWKSVLLVVTNITILSFITTFTFKITDINHFQSDEFNSYVFIVIVLLIIAFNYFAFRYIGEESNKLKILEKLFKDK